MIIKLGNEQYNIEFDEQNSSIIVDGVKMPVVQKYGYAWKCYKQPRQIGADGGITALKKFFQSDICDCFKLQLCRFVLGKTA